MDARKGTDLDLFTAGPLTYSTFKEAVRFAQPRRSRQIPKPKAAPPQIACSQIRLSNLHVLPSAEGELLLVSRTDNHVSDTGMTKFSYFLT
jgi:hypothetical protein